MICLMHDTDSWPFLPLLKLSERSWNLNIQLALVICMHCLTGGEEQEFTQKSVAKSRFHFQYVQRCKARLNIRKHKRVKNNTR